MSRKKNKDENNPFLLFSFVSDFSARTFVLMNFIAYQQVL